MSSKQTPLRLHRLRSSGQSIPMQEDRISTLPTEILCHILSFLPIKLAIATSLISKRWTRLWLSVLTLDVDDKNFKDFSSFCHFVQKFIASRDPTLPIRSFRIRCGNNQDFKPFYLNQIVKAALQRGTQNFDLEVFNPMLYNQKELIPTVLRVLNCRTLVVLKLKKLTLTVFDVPNLVQLPSLKTLHLDSIYFLSHFVSFKNLINGCPILENFHLYNVVLPHNKSIDSEGEFKGFPKLVRANFVNIRQNFPFAWFCNAIFLRAYLRSRYEYRVPAFNNLTYMELIFDFNDGWLGIWNWMIQVLQYCPKLQSLIIDEGYWNLAGRSYVYEDWKDPETVPKCLSSHLRTCCIGHFKGKQCGLQFAEYIMLNSKQLCTMTIKSNGLLYGYAKDQMLEKLSSYPRGSVTCKLLFD